MRTASTDRRRHATGEQGSAMVEMAIVLPILLLLVFGITGFGRLYNAQITVTHAAREGIRDYAIHQDVAQAESLARQAVSTTLNPGPMLISTSPCNPGEPATMAITYPFSLTVPFFGDKVVTLSADGVMRCGG